MQEIASGVFLTQEYPLVTTGYVVHGGKGLAIDCPYMEEDVQDWMKALSRVADPAYCVLTDHHPERSIGARSIQIPQIGHELARTELIAAPDTYKGNANPIGSDIDRLKRVTGMSRAVPDLTFSEEMHLDLEGLTIHFEHHPGPMSSAIWVIIPDLQVMFIGDSVPTDQPPFLGPSLIQEWLDSLDELRENRFRDYRMISARNGLIERNQINDAARFLRKVRDRIEKLEKEPENRDLVEQAALELLEDFPRSEDTDARFQLRLVQGMAEQQLRIMENDVEES